MKTYMKTVDELVVDGATADPKATMNAKKGIPTLRVHLLEKAQ